ncbi:hypothetical protein [Pelagibius sp.]|uniref:hypothetical protein n=1 Tax=Pelagibius sp. TaxID=1931238 RepID=UPI00260375CA|nr:hypothetical protein [Pelagibius sp.]
MESNDGAGPTADKSWLIDLALVPSKPPASGYIFSFSEYLATLALLLVVVMISDFRYRYRLATHALRLQVLAFWIAVVVGLLLLAIDVWFENSLPIPDALNNANNLKVLLGLVFLISVFYVVFVAFVRPPRFGRLNAERFLLVTWHTIHQGNPEKLQIVAEELDRSIDHILALATPNSGSRVKSRKRRSFSIESTSSELLLLLADRRFCQVVVDKVPGFAARFFLAVQKRPNCQLPVSQFARNIGTEFIRNTESSFYQEESGHESGLFGYVKPLTKIIFGSHQFIEQCNSMGASPLSFDFGRTSEFNKMQMRGFSRAALAFFDSYIRASEGRTESYALNNILSSFKHSVSGTYRLNGKSGDEWDTPEHHRLDVTINFIQSAVQLVDKHTSYDFGIRKREGTPSNILDDFSDLIFRVIIDASAVSEPEWNCWSIQHNSVWAPLFDFDDSKTMKVIRIKVRRLIYEEIRRMDRAPNFKGARILGFCLNVLGLTPIDRHRGYGKEFFPTQIIVLDWTKKNYRRLLRDHPKVAESCLHGWVSYDKEMHRIVKTFSNETGREPKREFLELD